MSEQVNETCYRCGQTFPSRPNGQPFCLTCMNEIKIMNGYEMFEMRKGKRNAKQTTYKR